MKSLNESGEDFAHRECGCGGEVCGEQLPQSSSQVSSIKQNDGFRVSGRKMCGHNTALVGGVADGKA